MISNYQMNNVMNALIGKATLACPTTLYLALSSTSVNADGTGITEPSGKGYTRVAIANNKTSFTDAELGAVRNKISVSFPQSTDDWGTITHVLLFDAQTGGNMLYYDKLEKERIIQSDSILNFPIGGLEFVMKNQTV